MTSPDFPRNTADVAAVAEWLMATESTSGHESALLAALDEALAGQGYHVERIAVDAVRFNVLATSGDGPFVTLSTHLDTVPPYLPPRREGDVLHGRGACDAKGIAACMIAAADRIRRSGHPVALLFVVGEETTHDGAHAADDWCVQHNFRSIALVNGEPTESTLALGTKGAMRFRIEAQGEAAHSAYPHLGRSATQALVTLLAELPSLELPADDLLGETTINIGSLAGGVADNVIAPRAEARMMARLVGDSDELWELVRRWVGDRATVVRGIEVPPVRLGRLAGLPTSVVAFATDIPALPSWGTPYLYGPGSIHVAHRDDEHVSIAELERAVGVYERIVTALYAEAESASAAG